MTLSAAAAAGLLASTACHSAVGEHYGDAFRAQRSMQAANPAAGNEPADPNAGIDGTTIDRTLEEYRKPISEKTAPVQQSTILEISN